MRKLIVHADDFALTKNINEGILHAHKAGILTSTSIMAIGSAFEHAVEVYKSAPRLDVGVHLALVEEKPILPCERIPTLVGKDGRFYPHATEFIKKYLMGKICIDEVFAEIEAQIKRVKQFGFRISHIDGHQHLHMLPGILSVTVQLANKYGIPVIRFPFERLRMYMLRNIRFFSRIPQLLALNFFCRISQKKLSLRTDHFVGFFFGGNLNKKNLLDLLVHLPSNGIIELMCHPGFLDLKASYPHWDYHWQDELNALIDPDIKKFITDNAIELISFRQLAFS